MPLCCSGGAILVSTSQNRVSSIIYNLFLSLTGTVVLLPRAKISCLRYSAENIHIYVDNYYYWVSKSVGFLWYFESRNIATKLNVFSLNLHFIVYIKNKMLIHHASIHVFLHIYRSDCSF